jgi:2-oxoisovalerate dehydrogenase E1 component
MLIPEPNSRARHPADAVHSLKARAEAASGAMRKYLGDPRNRPQIETALRIRAVETSLYALFGKGKLHGTIHTCVGQEFSGALVGKYLRPDDFVFSNHRCHGHFIAASGNWRGLIDELVGNRDGVCAGIGSSQHLWNHNFISNGQQGGLLPVAAGVALDRKMKGSDGIAISFIGEGTLGEGIVYETFNLDALWELPHLVICENNYYSQSTPQAYSVAGNIAQRAAAFGVRVFEADTWNLPHLDETLAEAFRHVRNGEPAFLVTRTYRLNPHSKGDDQRDPAELQFFAERDPLNVLLGESEPYSALYGEIRAETEAWAEAALHKPALAPEEYFGDLLPRRDPFVAPGWRVTLANASPDRVNQQLNRIFHEWFLEDQDAVFLGEDIADPYGGAFKVAKELTNAFGERVRTTPISEAGITGAGIGLALAGRHAIVEIMFGDFVTYAFDQLVNNASKFFHMYHRRVTCPVVLRTPMGGRRGYGPTHSQSLERFLIGIDNCCAIGLSSIVDVALQLSALPHLRGPAILIENKIDYVLKTFQPPENVVVEMDDALFPTLRIRPQSGAADLTIVSYGGMARYVADRFVEIFERSDAVPEIIVPTLLHPLDMSAIVESATRTRHVLIVEEGAPTGGVGAEIIAELSRLSPAPILTSRLGGKPVPIPSVPSLEAAALPGIDEICAGIASLLDRLS